MHLKSKLLTYPGGRFAPHDEDQRARFGAYALYRRAAEAVTVRVHADTVLDGHGQERRLIVLGDLNDTPQAATTQLLYGAARVSVRHWRIRPPRSRRCLAAVEPGTQDPRGAPVLPDLRGSTRTNRPHPDQPRPARRTGLGRRRRVRLEQHRNQPERSTGRTRVRSRPTHRPLHLTLDGTVRMAGEVIRY